MQSNFGIYKKLFLELLYNNANLNIYRVFNKLNCVYNNSNNNLNSNTIPKTIILNHFRTVLNKKIF